MVSHFENENIGLVHSLPVSISKKSDASRHGIGPSLERIYFGGYIARNYLLAQLFGLNCVTGMSLMFPKDLLSMTEFNQLSLHLAEDHFLARLIKDKGFKTKLSTHPAFQNSSEATVRLHFKRLQRWSKLRLSIAGPLIGLLEPIQTCFVQSLLMILSLLPFIKAYSALFCGFIYIALWFVSDVNLMKTVSKSKNSNESVFQFQSILSIFVGWIISELLFLPALFTSIFNPYIIWRNRKYRILADTKAVPIVKK